MSHVSVLLCHSSALIFTDYAAKALLITNKTVSQLYTKPFEKHD